jgi:cytochrome P450
MGIPVEDRPAIGRHGETLGTSRDARAMLDAAHQLAEYAGSLARARQAGPRDDLVSALVQADVDGEQLSPAQIGSFFTLLVVAGAQTTRHAIGAGVVALAGAAAQRAHWVANGAAATPAAIEEILRWSTPVRHFRRTATCATELGGKPIAAGDKVVVWYTSANRDESVFDDPRRFDLARSRNPHVAFGAGPHFCLGAALARHELTAVFDALLRHAPDYVVTHTERIHSPFAAGYKHVHCKL